MAFLQCELKEALASAKSMLQLDGLRQEKLERNIEVSKYPGSPVIVEQITSWQEQRVVFVTNEGEIYFSNACLMVAKSLEIPFCVARRTRAQIGKVNRVSYSEYFKEEFSDDSEDEEASSEDNEGGDSEGVNSSSGSEGVSRRTRSRFNSAADPKMKKMGAARNPVCLDVDELQSEEDEVEDDGIGMDLDRGKGKWVCNRNKGGSGMNTKVSNGVRDGNRTKMQDTDISKGLVERKRKWVDSDTEDAGRMGTQVSNMMESKRTSKKRKRVRPPNANELFKILANNIFNEDNSVACQNNLLPLLFSFGDDDAKPVEKAEHEKELDDSWADFDFATEANNIGVYHDDEV